MHCNDYGNGRQRHLLLLVEHSHNTIVVGIFVVDADESAIDGDSLSVVVVDDEGLSVEGHIPTVRRVGQIALAGGCECQLGVAVEQYRGLLVEGRGECAVDGEGLVIEFQCRGGILVDGILFQTLRIAVEGLQRVGNDKLGLGPLLLQGILLGASVER